MKNCGSVRLNREIEKECDPTSRSIMIVVWKKKNVWAIWIVLGETQSNSNKAGTGNQNNPLFYSFGAYVSNDSINDFSQNTILSNIVYDVKLFSTIIRENDSTMETSLKKIPTNN